MWGAKLTRCVRAPGVRCAHPRARARAKEAFPAHESVLKKKCAQTKTSSKKTQKNVFGGRACARNKFYVACFVYLSFAAAKLPAEAATCVFLKKKHKTCKPINFSFFVKMHRLCCARVISPQFLWGETIPSCAMGMCAPDAGGGVTGPDTQGVPLV